MNALLPEVIAAEPVERKFLKAAKAGELTGYDYDTQLADAEAKGVLNAAERTLLARVRKATFEFISVDDFDSSELGAAAHREGKRALRSVA
jgi:acyl-CoA dehydrogenase